MAASAGVSESFVEVDGVRVFARLREGEGDPVVFSHGNPTHSGDWPPFIERLERPAVAFDLPGWGRSQAPRDFEYSMRGLARFFGRALDALGVERHALVVHDWGALALIDVAARPCRLERLVVINAVPLLPGYRWHWIARWFWRRRAVGELFNVVASKAAFRQLSRQATPRPGPMPEAFVETVWSAWPRGTTHRPLLELYRSADPAELARAGAGLGALDCPSLVLWGGADPYIPVSFAGAYAERLPAAELRVLADAGHWPWIDRPDAIDGVTAFLAG